MKTFYRRSCIKTKGCMMVMVTLNMIEKLDRFNNQNTNIVADAVKNIVMKEMETSSLLIIPKMVMRFRKNIVDESIDKNKMIWSFSSGLDIIS